eukprot:Skav232619  [mRNA]  locus=scaffold1260:75182:77886:+ [translate_table: standard]
MEQNKRVSFSEDPKKSTVKASKGPGEKWKVGPQYEVKQLIGTGSYGSVCEAFDTSKKCLVAVKRIGHMFEDLVDCKAGMWSRAAVAPCHTMPCHTGKSLRIFQIKIR